MACISGKEAHEWRLVEYLTEPGESFQGAMKLAEQIAAQPPIAVAMTKQTVNRLSGALDDLASHMDLDQHIVTCMTQDYKEGMAGFLEKRKPNFQGS